ncbi:MAG: hypothetical protein II453_09230, partial [Alphaproteobacteria bacterium]|nr:hypothetical protein [Alphaproteobacteria bacterium]
NILNEVDIKYQKLLSEQLANLKRNHEKVMKQLRVKYAEDIKVMAKIDADKINLLSEFALQKLFFNGKRI